MNDRHPDYADAVVWARSFIEETRFRGGQDLLTPAGFDQFVNESVGKILGYSHSRGYPNGPFAKEPGEFCPDLARSAWGKIVDDMLQDAASNRKTFDATMLGIARIIENGGDLHPKLSHFLIQVLRGEVKAPPRAKGRGSSAGLHMLVVKAINGLVTAGWKPTRGPASAPTSACDVLADALSGMQICAPITYDGVAKIWKERLKL